VDEGAEREEVERPLRGNVNHVGHRTERYACVAAGVKVREPDAAVFSVEIGTRDSGLGARARRSALGAGLASRESKGTHTMHRGQT
jgi:hypothetical protein